MQLSTQEFSLSQFGASVAPLSAGQTFVWPAGQPIQNLADPNIFATRFFDSPMIHSAACARLVKQASTMPANRPDLGGRKVRDAETWNLPEMQLLTQRALYFLCQVRNAPAAHVVDRWANVMVRGEYSSPHAHYLCDTAVVYLLDPGDTAHTPAAGGNFTILDPRIEFCCPRQPARPTRTIQPVLPAGAMLLFPSEILHHVDVYYGNRPRITLAWNLSLGPVPPSGVADFTQQDHEVRGKM